MVLAFPLALAVAAIIARRRKHLVGTQGRGCRWFWAWTFAGALISFSFLTGFSIGLLVLPFALGALFGVAWYAPHWGESIGFLEGVAAMLLLVAYLNRDYDPCPANGVLIAPTTPGASVSCGGLDPQPWLLSGVATGVIGLASYAALLALRRKNNSSPT